MQKTSTYITNQSAPEKTSQLPGMSRDLLGNEKESRVWHARYSWPAHMEFPVFPVRFSDVSRWDYRWLQHINYPGLALELELEGETEYKGLLGSDIAKPGELYVVTPHSNVRMVKKNKGKRRKLALLVFGNCLELIAEAIGFREDALLKLSDPPLIEQKMRQIGRIISENASPIEASKLTYELLLLLAKEKQMNTLPTEIQAVKNILHQDFSQKINLGKLADSVNLSISTLRRKFVKHLACTPQQYLNILRMDHAKMLLKNPRIPIKEVAFRCGFSSSLVFGIAYKKYYGVPPGRHRHNGAKI